MMFVDWNGPYDDVGQPVAQPRFGDENTAQHAENKAALGRIDGKLDRLDTRLDGHGERLAKVVGRLEGRRRRRRGGW